MLVVKLWVINHQDYTLGSPSLKSDLLITDVNQTKTSISIKWKGGDEMIEGYQLKWIETDQANEEV